MNNTRIFIDIGHPAHVHYFKNFINELSLNGCSFFISARDKEITFNLLKEYNLKFFNRGSGKNNILAKFYYLIKTDIYLFFHVRKFKPNIAVSFGSVYAAHVSKLLGIPHIAFDDTEHATEQQLLTNPFCDVILTPKCFKKNYGKKQIRFDGFMELCYLHPKYFKPNISILQSYDIESDIPFYILRFVSWNASHDIGQTGLSSEAKNKLVDLLTNYGRVLISSECDLPEQLEKYRIKIDPSHFHHLLFFSNLYIGEGATTASECVMLGTPAIYVNSLDAGTLSEQAQKYGLISLRNSNNIFREIESILHINSKNTAEDYKRQLLFDKIDVTAFMVWFVENYPDSFEVMKKDPLYQNRFK